MEGYYVLDEHTVIKCDDVFIWAKSFDVNKRRVALTNGFKVRVSTVFLGLDHSFGFGPPLLFETMVFGKNEWIEKDCERYSTWLEAEAGHRQMCIAVNLHPLQRAAKILLWLPSIYIICRLVFDY